MCCIRWRTRESGNEIGRKIICRSPKALAGLASAGLAPRALTRLIAARSVVSFRPNFAARVYWTNFAAALFRGAQHDGDMFAFLLSYLHDLAVAKFAVAYHARDY